MKDRSYWILYLFCVFCALFLICFSLDSHAALTINNLPGGGYRIDGYGTANTANNPTGQTASSSGGGSAGLTMGSNFPVVVAPPSGSTPGTSLINVALAAGSTLGGAAVLSNNYSSTISGPQVAGFLQLAGNALVVGSMFCGPAQPACALAGFAVASAPNACTLVGCTFFNAVAAQGITRNADGSFNKTITGTAILSGAMWKWPIQNYTYGASISVACGVSSVIYPSLSWDNSYCYTPSSKPNPFPSSTAPATNADIVSAVNAVTAATNRSTATAVQNAAAADAINLALLDGLNMSTLAETAVATTIASSFALQKTSTDALGNTVQELSRNLISMSPGANASQPPLLQPSTQNVTVTNGSPTATTTTTSGPQVSAPTPGALPGVTAPSSSSPSDLCLLHPEILACADITKLNDLPAVVIPNTNKNLTTLTPVALGGPAICPPPLILPLHMGGPPVVLDLAKPICNFATSIRAINLICGGLASLFIISLGFKQNG